MILKTCKSYDLKHWDDIECYSVLIKQCIKLAPPENTDTCQYGKNDDIPYVGERSNNSV